MGTDIMFISFFERAFLEIRGMSTLLKKKGFSVEVVVYGTNYQKVLFRAEKNNKIVLKGMKNLLEIIEKKSPKVIGIITTCSSSFHVLKPILKILKKKTKSLILLGGPHTLICPEESILYSDCICIGDGEEAVEELLSKMKKKQDFTNLKGFWFRNGEKIKKNPPRPLIKNIYELPFPEQENRDYHYILSSPLSELGVYYLSTSRGCPFSCTYCWNSIPKKTWGTGALRIRSPKNVISELKEAIKKNKKIKHIVFVDNTISHRGGWSKKFLNMYKKEINLPASCFIDPLTKPDEINLLKEAGFVFLKLGIESGSEKILNMYNRIGTKDGIKKITKLIESNGMLMQYDVIVKNPLESLDDVKQTFNFLMDIPKPFYLNLSILELYPKTELIGLFEKKAKKRFKSRLFAENEIPETDKRKSFWYLLLAIYSLPIVPKTLVKAISKLTFLERFYRINNFLYGKFDAIPVRLSMVRRFLLSRKKISLDFNR
jgi:radical SAM superfamily enzyme YgiQ (UPF0313 family)